jgi:cytochrome oxidase Cu insertion factor (SCO1/SenC/PrrC family)
MSQKETKYSNTKKYTVFGGILFFILLLVFSLGKCAKHQFKEPLFFGPNCLSGCEKSDFIIPDFVFTLEDNQIINRDTLFGDIWVAAFYSMNDANLSKITERLLNVNFRFRDEEDVRIIVFSENDSVSFSNATNYVSQLNRYNVNPKKWTVALAPVEPLKSFMRNGFGIEDSKNEALFYLVDMHGQIRGWYGNTEYHMEDLMEDIALLKKIKKNEARGKR